MFEDAKTWFEHLRDRLVEKIQSYESQAFVEKKWSHHEKGGGLMTKINGNIIEKGGINISTVSGKFNEKMQEKILGAKDDPSFSATGISVVLHPRSPHIPSMHFNTRFLSTTKTWFGGGMDLTPCLNFENETKDFHKKLKIICDKFDINCYEKYKKWCDDYFFLKHRNEPRGVGGIFFDHVFTSTPENDFEFVKNVGQFSLNILAISLTSLKTKPGLITKRKFNLLKEGDMLNSICFTIGEQNLVLKPVETLKQF